MGCTSGASGGGAGKFGTNGRNTSSTRTTAIAEYERIPLTVMYGRGTEEDMKTARATVRRFIDEAEVGNEYVASGGTGGSPSTFKIVDYNRSPNKMGIQGENSRPVALNTTNAKKYLATNVKLVKGTKKAPNTKFTQAELNKMSRKKLESTALQVARKLASKQGISEAEAERRAKMLMSSNSDAQLRKYIKKNG